MMLWVAFAIFDQATSWVIFKLVTMAVVCGALFLTYRVLVKDLLVPHTVAWLCVLHLGLLAGFTPKSGNPGNIAAPLAVSGALLALINREHLGGVALGTSIALKYPLGLPVLGILILARKFRTAGIAISVFLLLNVLAIGWLYFHSCNVAHIPHSVFAGVSHVGGYDDSGFKAWFSAATRGKYSTLSATGLFASLGFSRAQAHVINLTLLAATIIVSSYIATRTQDKILLPLAILCPGFLTFTYHRYYDSALLAFPVMLTWTMFAKNQGRLRLTAGIVIIMSLFLVRSLPYNLVYRLGVPEEFLMGFLYNFVIGPLHIYALFCMIGFGVYLALSGNRSCEADKHHQ